MSVLSALRGICIATLVPVCLTGCSEDPKGVWVNEDKRCVHLCEIRIYFDDKTREHRLMFDNNKTNFARLVGGLFENNGDAHYRLRFSNKGSLDFTLKEGKLVAEKGSVFTRRSEP